MPNWPQYPLAVLVSGANFTVQTAAYTAKSGDVVLANSTAAAFTVTLPAVATGGPVTVKKTDPTTANAVTLKTADGSTIDGVAGTTGTSITAQNGKVTLVSDGTNWWVVA